MIIKCPECELQVSDKANSCPHCGYPIQSNAGRRKTRNKNNKRRRLPNGFGQISEIKNRNLRNSFRAMITIGKTPTGKPICKLLKPKSFFETYNDAYTALVEYNKNPYDLNKDITVNELYDVWSKGYFETLKSDSSIRVTKAAWAYCSSIYDMNFADVRIRHIKGCMDNGIATIYGKVKNPSPVMKSKIKLIFNLMFDYALEYEIVDKNFARTFHIPKNVKEEINESKKGHIPFTNQELKTLWDHVDSVKYADVILIQCYSGWRPQELGLIKIEDVNLDDNIFIGGMKTSAGKNRVVPIHSKIKKLVENRYEEASQFNSDYLINYTDMGIQKSRLKFTYDKYTRAFNKIQEQLALNSEHRPHDGRVTFVTLAKKYNVDEYAIKYMVGHSIQDITERVYTKRESIWLREEIEKIK